MHGDSKHSATRLIALLVGATIAVPCIVVSLLALNTPATVTYLATAAIVTIGAALANAKAPVELAVVATEQRGLFILWLILTSVAVYRISSLAFFMEDPSLVQYAYQRSFRPLDDAALTKPFYLKHNCSTSYMVAAYVAGQHVDNIYDRKYYRNAEEKTPVHETIGETFHIDQYQYPPPFLLGPYLARATGLNFFQLRSLWFALNVLLYVLTSVALTVWICGWAFSALWLIWPGVLLCTASIVALQIGNAHIFMVLISILAMLLFEKKHHALGGTLLAYATLSKFFPGLLIIYLLFRRSWRAFAWTAALCFALSIATLWVFGVAPYKAFLDYQLPAIASGKAFWFAFEMPHAMLANSSIMGMPYKLKGMGIASKWDPKTTASVVVWLYTLVAITIAAIAGSCHAATRKACPRGSDPAEVRLSKARIWAALIVLAQLRSPFLPSGYGAAAILIFLTLLLPVEKPGLVRLLLIAAGMSLFATQLPLAIGPSSSAFDFGVSFLATATAVVVAITVALRRPRSLPDSPPASASCVPL